jgi:hypothetical protein
MRLSNPVALLLLAASLSPTAWASTPKKHPAATANEPLEFAIEVLGARTSASGDELPRRIAADSGSCVWSVVSTGPHSQRLYVGLFQQEVIARDYGNRLIGLGLIAGFRVEPVYEPRAFTRARSVADCKQLRYAAAESTTSPGTETGGPFESISRDADEAGLSGDVAGSEPGPALATDSAGDEARASSDGNIFLPRMSFSLELSFRVAVESRGPIPQPNPAARAIYELTGRIPGAADGGLWLSGDVEEATDRLRWILGEQDSGLIKTDSRGRVNLDLNLLNRAAGAAEQDGPGGWLKLGEYLSANVGPFPGAHDMALEREQRLKAQRPGSYVVISAGQNILFRSQTELKRMIEIRGQTGAQ